MRAVRNLSHLERDRGYRWADRDPVLDFVTRDITDSGWPLSYVAERSGVSVAALRCWMNGRTRRPANATVEAVLTALGWHRTITTIDGT